MPVSKRKRSRQELVLGVALALLTSPIVGAAILFTTLSIILSILVLAQTGETEFYAVIAFYAAILGMLYVLLWRILRRTRLLVTRWRSERREMQRTADLVDRVQSAQHRLSSTSTAEVPALSGEHRAQPAFSRR